jgi:hypothetical protein
MKYKLNVKRDVDIEKNDFGTDYILTLPYGWRFDDEIVHVRGYDSLKELRDSVKTDVIVCGCQECVKNK